MRPWLALLLIGCAAPHAGALDGGVSDRHPHRDAAVDATPADATPDGAPADGAAMDAALPDGGDASPSCPVGQWCPETAPISSTIALASVWAVSSSDVFAVGDAGTIIRRVNGTWTSMTSNTTANLRGVWAESSTDVWAVGSGGAVVHYDGSSWTPITGLTTIDLAAVWGSGASDVWIVGPNTVLHWNGSTWSNTGLAGELLSVSGTGPNDVWVCGENAYVRHYTGTWSAPIVPIAGTTDYFAVTANASDVWVTSIEAARYASGSWTTYSTGYAVFQSLYEIGSNDIWAAGGRRIGHWNGTAWSTSSTALTVHGVSGAGSDVFVVGDGATILHRD